MNRFEKEMRKHFPGISFDEDMYGNKDAYCIAEKALIVFTSPGLIEVLQFLPNGKQKDVSDDYPEISAPYLVHLYGGNIEKAKSVLKARPHF